MCTTIAASTAVTGSGKGRGGWFSLDRVHVGYDHPAHARLEHAVSLDFVDEGAGPGARVAVELSRESARALAAQIVATLAEADAYEGG